MKTVKLHINSCGYLQGSHPMAKPGPDNLIYEIRNVPDDKPLPLVIKQVQGLILAHSMDGAENWIYDWNEVGHLPIGSIINRYPKKSAA